MSQYTLNSVIVYNALIARNTRDNPKRKVYTILIDNKDPNYIYLVIKKDGSLGFFGGNQTSDQIYNDNHAAEQVDDHDHLTMNYEIIQESLGPFPKTPGGHQPIMAGITLKYELYKVISEKHNSYVFYTSKIIDWPQPQLPNNWPYIPEDIIDTPSIFSKDFYINIIQSYRKYVEIVFDIGRTFDDTGYVLKIRYDEVDVDWFSKYYNKQKQQLSSHTVTIFKEWQASYQQILRR